MKKIIVSLIILCLITINCIPAYANTIVGADTIEELRQNEELILESANQILSNQIVSPIKGEDIDYSKAIKVYVDVDILEDSELNAEKMRAYAEKAEYIYYLPIYLGEESICLTISKGKEVSEQAKAVLESKDIERLQSLVGKWYVPEVEIFSGHLDYINDIKSTLENSNINDSKVYFLGGISGNLPLVAVLCSENSNAQFKIIDGFDSGSSITEAGDGNIAEEDNILYSYNEIKAIASEGNLKSEQTGAIGQTDQTNSKKLLLVFFVSVIVILGLSTATICIFKKRAKGEIMISKKKFTNFLMFVLVLAIISASSIPAFAAVSGKWIQSGKRWWYRHNDASYTSNDWEIINNKWYHFDNDGWMQTGWQKINGKWYYLTANGDMATGWQKINGKWYYLTSNGDMTTGWQKINGKWYYLTANGDMATGWQKINGKWYYLTSNGDMATGWQKIDGKWYYLTSNGDMATGWQKINGKWYYLTANGDMATGWQKISDKWYYLNDDGAMQIGWCTWNADTYYLKNNGAMAVGWTEIDSLWYYFDNSGAMCRNQWIGKYYVNLYGEWVENTEITFDKAVVKIDIGYYEGVPANSQKASTDDSEIISQLVAYLSELKVTNRNIEEKTGGSCYTITVYYIDGTSDEFDIVKDDSVLWYEGVPYDVDVQQIEAVWENISKY